MIIDLLVFFKYCFIILIIATEEIMREIKPKEREILEMMPSYGG